MQRKVNAANRSYGSGKTVDYIFLIIVSLFMIIAPFYRGLFFRVNYIPAIAIISIIFAAFMIYKVKDKNYRVINTYMDLTVLLIPVAYLISFFFAVNAKDAFDMVLLYSSYFMMYKLASDLSAKDERYRDIFINIIIASAFILATTSIMNISGVININGASIGKRIFGLYQYANTTASVLGVGIILSLNKLINEEDVRKVVIYQMALAALIATFIFTLSRGGALVLAGVLFLNFLLVKARVKLKMLLGLIISFISSIVLIFKFYTLPEERVTTIWIYYVITIVISAFLIYAVCMVKEKVKFKLSDRYINLSLITIIVILSGIVFFLFSVKEPMEYRVEHMSTEKNSVKSKSFNFYELEAGSKYTVQFYVRASIEKTNSYGIGLRSYNSSNQGVDIIDQHESVGSSFTFKSFDFEIPEDTERIVLLLYNYESGSYSVFKDIVIKDANGITVKRMERFKYLPLVISDRLIDVSSKTEEVYNRVTFLKDALKIIKDYPICGAGGGAWKNLYRQYQSMPYNTTEVHNFYVQYGTEVGILGLSALLGLLSLLFVSMIKSLKSESRFLYVYLAVMLLLIHSMIDFNLSLAAVGYILWLLVGIISGDKHASEMLKTRSKYISLLVLIISAIILIISASMYYGIRLGIQGAEISREGKDYDNAARLYEKAMKFDRFNGAYRIDFSQIMAKKLRETKDRKYLRSIDEQVSLLQRNEPYNHQYTPVICSIYLSIGKFEEASDEADKKLSDEPLLEQSYTVKIDVNYEIAGYYLKNNDAESALLYLQKIIEANKELEKINKRLQNVMKLDDDHYKKVEVAVKTIETIKSNTKH